MALAVTPAGAAAHTTKRALHVRPERHRARASGYHAAALSRTTFSLGRYLVGKYGGRFEDHNCRRVQGSQNLSLHAEGRAVDFYSSNMAQVWLNCTSQKDPKYGSRKHKLIQAFNHAIDIACSNGIQEVIYNRQIWTHANGVRPYRGASPHTDHVHIGLNRCGARNFGL
jgi:hypothetical protein